MFLRQNRPRVLLLGISFLLITAASIGIFYYGTGKNRSIQLPLTIWILVIGMSSYLGFWENTTSFPPRMIILFLCIIGLVVFLIRQIEVTDIHEGWLTSIHILRIPVELTLLELFLSGQLPEIMTFQGWNFDIVVGITAIPLLVMRWFKVQISPTLLRYWNIFGIVMLAIIVTIAILSAPTPLQQLAFEQPNRAVTQFPYTFLPAVVVPLVFLSHLLTLKRLAMK